MTTTTATVTSMPFAALSLGSSDFTNPRETGGLDDESIDELAVSIALHGVLVPLLVRPDGVIVSGQRRYRAMRVVFEAWKRIHDRFVELADPATRAASVERVAQLRQAVPVRVLEATGLGLEGIALAENLLRADMSSHDIARRLALMSEAGATGIQIAAAIGKSPAYVSNKLCAWRGACPELRRAWELGGIGDERVLELSRKPHDMQRRILVNGVPRRGATNRPGIDQLKDLLHELKKRESESPLSEYEAGVADALRWACGEKPTRSTFTSLLDQ